MILIINFYFIFKQWVHDILFLVSTTTRYMGELNLNFTLGIYFSISIMI